VITDRRLSLSLALAAAALLPAGGSLAAPHAAHAAKPAAHHAKPAPAPAAAASNAVQSVAGGAPPVLDSKAYLLLDYDSGEVLAASNPDEPLPPASLTKMMTSFLVEQALRAGKLKQDDLVTTSLTAWSRGSSPG